MDMLQIRYFISVAENMSFTMASRELYVSQPAISKQIAALEDELGIKLFERQGKTISLTSAGKVFYNDSKTLLEQFDEMIQRARDISNSVLGELHVGMLQFTDITKVAPGLIKNFYTIRPDIRVVLHSAPQKTLIKDLTDNNIDCAFLRSPSAIELQKQMPFMRFDLPRAPHTLLFSRSKVSDDVSPTINDFINEPFVILVDGDEDIKAGKTTLNVVSWLGITPKNIIWVNSLDVGLLYIKEGLGVGIMGPNMRFEDSSHIRHIPIPLDLAKMGMSFCWKIKNENPALKIFFDILKGCQPDNDI